MHLRKHKYKTVYIDAFAGTGYRIVPESKKAKNHLALFEPQDNPVAPITYDGSAHVALQIEPAFDYYVFVEKSPRRVSELEKLKTEFPKKNILVRKSDANQYLIEKCTGNQVDWSRYRAVLFLDPFGMSVKWSTLEVIAKTQAFDIWYLFPLGAGANRLLMKDRSKITKAWRKKLDETFGTDAWYEEFYQTDNQSLFSSLEGLDIATTKKTASFKKLKAFVVRQLKDLFGENCVAENPKILPNTKNSPMYLLCFATSNPNAATPAIKIAQHMLKE